MNQKRFTPEDENLFVVARHASPLQKGVFHGKASATFFPALSPLDPALSSDPYIRKNRPPANCLAGGPEIICSGEG
jgi:hypothetical protein